MHLALPSQKPKASPSRCRGFRLFGWLHSDLHRFLALHPVTMPLDKDAESQTQYKKITPYDAYDMDELSDTDSSDDTLAVASKVRPALWRQSPLSRLWICIYIVVFGLYASSWVACMSIVWRAWNRPLLA
ncbi:hypothetical protein M406DRAFT_355853 [Cryphonectria parasitica EP155]|uniref:Uncharacterized protein n=1 Tax=Cryphonectria parasitica (strain ATCC 38755 / EP155) TaxID=660469 RepID=A0A9P5CPC7_CRYP1|nr:uncharacterized protein M406DRAFT_355853 [Cryphonectria parasitica EP155]KAF3765272.1 hypothetical protein M406DRAFT_355853 [Cryphonectria parasitica EP155]